LIVKRILPAMLAIAALLPVAPARAQVFGQYTGATVTPVDGHVFGAYLNVSSSVVGGLSQLRLSLYPKIDFGFQGGLSRLEPGGSYSNRTTLRVGGDVRWQLASLTGSFPADLAIGAGLGVETSDQYKVITLGPSMVMSRTMGGADGGGYIPYAGLGLNFVSRDAFGVEDTDFSMPLRLGLVSRLTPECHLVTELQLFIVDRFNDNVGFSAGVNLPF
jgi:hypothetical protein